VDAGEDAGEPAMPFGRDNAPIPGDAIDRMGRALITSALIGTFTGADETAIGTQRDMYNGNVDFASWGVLYPTEIGMNLGVWDSLDAACDNPITRNPSPSSPELAYDDFAFFLSIDGLFVNSSRDTCPLYLGVEGEALGLLDATAAGCGGRRPTIDAVDQTLSVAIRGELTGVTDGVDADDATVDETTFPYLAAPL
jgi:hypothetical protein